ncbi:MAG: signal peptide peptidase SppA [Sphingomonas bacterium]|nr:signal peptide peptidase SppA [Sphingomonas bacterium]
MRFVRAIWKVLVGVKDALVLIVMLMFFGGLYAALSSRPAPISDGVLVLDLKGTITEQPSQAAFTDVLSGAGGIREYRLRDLIAALDNARTDDRVKSVALDLDAFAGGGQTAIGDLGEAVRRVRTSGKPVLAYATAYTDDSYQLASNASEIWLNPMGAVAIAGPGGKNLYYKGLMDKLGITANVYRVGTYKAAVEPFTRSDMSPEAKANAQALAGALLETWREHVAAARPKAAVVDYMRDPVAALDGSGGDLGNAAVAARLVDKLGERTAFEARLATLGGKDDEQKGGYRSIGLTNYLGDVLDNDPDGPIGIVTVAGEIVDGKASAGNAGGETIARLIEKGLRDDGMKALVVRVDSPGGSAIASERIRQAILGARAKKIPVVISMGNVAASGGYWVATAGDKIYAEPSTITGSIGVFGILPSFQGSLAKLGIGADGVKTTPLSGEPDLLAGPSPEAGRMIQAGVESIYRQFLTIVAQSRRKTPAEIDAIAQGRVWDGGTARQLGLVDGFGGLDEAIAAAAGLAKLGDERGVRYLDRSPTFAEEFMAMFSGDDAEAAPTDAFAALAPAPEALLDVALADVRRILAGPSIQVRCLDCPVELRTSNATGAKGWKATLLGWLG